MTLGIIGAAKALACRMGLMRAKDVLRVCNRFFALVEGAACSRGCSAFCYTARLTLKTYITFDFGDRVAARIAFKPVLPRTGECSHNILNFSVSI